MRRAVTLILAAAVALGACAYESSGTTTTTLPIDDDLSAPTGPADLVASDQRSEGSSMVIDSISMPSDGWIVVRADVGGTPGEIIGVSELLVTGIAAAVPVPFLVPIGETTTVHLAIHIDVDRDGTFLYEPPDSFIDEIATKANGEPATAVVDVSLLPPLSPADAFMDPQVTDGTAVVVAGALLPAAGFLTLQLADDEGAPGEVVAVTDLLPVGEVGETVLIPQPSLQASGLMFAVVWIDRDLDGLFAPGPDADEIGIREDGGLAAGGAEITVLILSPGSIVVADQAVADGQLTVQQVVAPSAGFIEVLADDGGTPGQRLAAVPVAQGTTEGFQFAVPGGAAGGGTLWLRLWVDADLDGVLSEGDQQALVSAGGAPVQVSFTFTP